MNNIKRLSHGGIAMHCRNENAPGLDKWLTERKYELKKRFVLFCVLQIYVDILQNHVGK